MKYPVLPVIALPLVFSACQNQQTVKEERSEKPNIIILFADDLGYGDLSCQGHPTIQTPNLDKMAEQGMRFTQFYVAASVSSPSRGALMTGRLPVRTGIYGVKKGVFFCESTGGIPESEITLAEGMKECGYATACIGKWHLGHLEKYLPTSKGFDYFYGIPYSNDMSPANNSWSGVSHCPPLPLMRGKELIEGEPNQDSLTYNYTQEAIKFIDKNKGQPFFLYLPYTFPHTPIHASENFRGKSKRGLYGDVVAEIDWSVGEILDHLNEIGIEKNTLVMFSSDNGPWYFRGHNGGSSGILFEGKGTAWEGGMRVPFIASWPGTIEAKTVNMSVANTMDVYVTALSLAGYEFPENRVYDGFDITPVLMGQKESVNDEMFYYQGNELYAFRKGAWKIHFKTIIGPYTKHILEEHDPPLLFNLNEDPSEKFNVYEEYPEFAQQMMEIVEKHKAGLVMPEPEFDKE